AAKSYQFSAAGFLAGNVYIPVAATEAFDVAAGAGDDQFIVFGEAPGTRLALYGGDGNDAFFNGVMNAENVRGPVTFDGQGGANNRIVISDLLDTTADQFHVRQDSISADDGDNLFGDGVPLRFSNVGDITITTGRASDQVTVEPSATATIHLSSSGAGTNRDALAIELAGATNPVFTPGVFAGSGTYSFDNRKPINYSGMGSVTVVEPAVPPDPDVTPEPDVTPDPDPTPDPDLPPDS